MCLKGKDFGTTGKIYRTNLEKVDEFMHLISTTKENCSYKSEINRKIQPR